MSKRLAVTAALLVIATGGYIHIGYAADRVSVEAAETMRAAYGSLMQLLMLVGSFYLASEGARPSGKTGWAGTGSAEDA
tara:strand:- start:326 stop:562 length:237 start_codon:yes stop_codon:yes gene_type:complete